MIQKRIYLVLIISFAYLTNSIAQEQYIFKEGLAIGAVHRYGREALYTDAVAQQLYTGTISPSEEGVNPGITDNKSVWKKYRQTA